MHRKIAGRTKNDRGLGSGWGGKRDKTNAKNRKATVDTACGVQIPRKDVRDEIEEGCTRKGEESEERCDGRCLRRD